MCCFYFKQTWISLLEVKCIPSFNQTKPYFKTKVWSNKDESLNFRLMKCQPTFHQTSLIKNKSPELRKPSATVFTLVRGKIDFHDFHFLTFSKQIKLHFDLKSIYWTALWHGCVDVSFFPTPGSKLKYLNHYWNNCEGMSSCHQVSNSHYWRTDLTLAEIQQGPSQTRLERL